MAKPGPKPKEINWSDFEKLCSLHCTLVEIAEWFKCSEDTIERYVKAEYKEGFAEVFKKKSSQGKISLRRKMYEAAMGGNITMMIWLSKQMLGYKDKIENENFNHDLTLTQEAEEVERYKKEKLQASKAKLSS